MIEYFRLHIEYSLVNSLHPSHLPVGQPDLDAVGMSVGSGEDVLDKTLCQFPGSLVFFQHDAYLGAGLNICPGLSVHQKHPFL